MSVSEAPFDTKNTLQNGENTLKTPPPTKEEIFRLPPRATVNGKSAEKHADATGNAAMGSATQPRTSGAKRRQVKNACTNCQKACKKCDECRPCSRCVKYNLVASCRDSPRKERRKPYKNKSVASSVGSGGKREASATSSSSPQNGASLTAAHHTASRASQRSTRAAAYSQAATVVSAQTNFAQFHTPKSSALFENLLKLCSALKKSLVPHPLHHFPQPLMGADEAYRRTPPPLPLNTGYSPPSNALRHSPGLSALVLALELSTRHATANVFSPHVVEKCFPRASSLLQNKEYVDCDAARTVHAFDDGFNAAQNNNYRLSTSVRSFTPPVTPIPANMKPIIMTHL